MTLRRHLPKFLKEEDGGLMVLWAFSLVVFLGLLGVIFDIGRLATTQSELQSYADSISLAAAAELDGRAGAITRAQGAATALITDTQTYGEGEKSLVAADVVTLTFFAPSAAGGFSANASLETTNPHRARFVRATIDDHTVLPGLGAAFSALGGSSFYNTVSAGATAGFELEACNVAPVAMCLPTVDFDAAANIGHTLEVSAAVNVTNLIPGQLSAVHTLTNALDGLSICAGLAGGALDACLIASRAPESACTGQGGLVISADVDGSDVLDAINTRFDEFAGIASGLAGNPDFSGGPNVLTGLTDTLGICLPNILPTNGIGLPADDCLLFGACGIQGDGNWSVGRAAYVEAHYDGSDPFPQAETRFEFYQAEIAASSSGGLGGLLGGGGSGGLLGGGGLLGTGIGGQLCAPQDNQDPTRRLMVIAGIDCSSAAVNANVTVPPVQQFFEVFALSPIKDGKLSVEITACLGGGCGTGNLDTQVRDIVRLVE